MNIIDSLLSLTGIRPALRKRPFFAKISLYIENKDFPKYERNINFSPFKIGSSPANDLVIDFMDLDKFCLFLCKLPNRKLFLLNLSKKNDVFLDDLKLSLFTIYQIKKNTRININGAVLFITPENNLINKYSSNNEITFPCPHCSDEIIISNKECICCGYGILNSNFISSRFNNYYSYELKEFSYPKKVTLDTGKKPTHNQEEKKTVVFSPSKLPAQITVLNGLLANKIINIHYDESIIGRSRYSTISLSGCDDILMSRFHVVINYKRGEGCYIINDNNSTNGTYLNGKLIKEEKIKNGDIIKMGVTEIQFNILRGEDING